MKQRLASWGERAALAVSRVVGTWRFIGLMTVMMTSWVVWNAVPWTYHFDPEPFMGFNLVLSLIAAYTGPILLMASNVQDEADRALMREDLAIDEETLVLLRRILAILEADPAPYNTPGGAHDPV